MAKEVTIDELINMLQNAKSEIGGSGIVRIGSHDYYCTLHHIVGVEVDNFHNSSDWFCRLLITK